MFSSAEAWKLACELACSGDYANIVMIERELRRRGVLGGELLTGNNVRRDLLTRVCHAARNGTLSELRSSRMFPFDGLTARFSHRAS